MKLYVGLGNPGKEYEGTRHNVGFTILDLLAKECKVAYNYEKRFQAEIATYRHKGEVYLFVKPQTYMNLSGNAVLAISNYYKIKHDDIIIVHDDLDLPVGKLRIRAQGSSAGQKGMKHIMDLLHTQAIKRIRVGISKGNIDIKDYVLSKFNSEEAPLYNESCIRAKDALIYAMNVDFNRVMNRYNG